jgi:hypothetical protein
MNLDMEVDDGVSEQQQGAISCGSYFLLLPSFYPILFHFVGNAEVKE